MEKERILQILEGCLLLIDKTDKEIIKQLIGSANTTIAESVHNFLSTYK